MMDNILNTVKRVSERVQRRGEEVAQVARLRMELFGLGRELDGAYARLGRAYNSGSDVDLLQGIRGDIARVEEEIAARERLIAELGADPEGATGSREQGASDTPPGDAVPLVGGALVKVDAPATAAAAPGNRPQFSDGGGNGGAGPGVTTEPNVSAAVPPVDPSQNGR